MARLFERLAHDLRRDAADLDIHLQRGNSIFGAGDFEIHIAVMVFGARDVGQNGVLVAFFHQSHSDARDGRLQRNTRVHQRERGSADGCHRRRPIRLENVRDDSHRIGPVILGRQHRRNGPFSQCAVSDFAASGAAQERDLANRERREVVVQHEALLGFALETFEALHVVAGAKRGGDQRLRFAAGEDGAPVGPGQHADFDPDFANLIEGPSIGAVLLVNDLIAEDALTQSLVILFELGLGGVILFRNRGQQLFFQRRTSS